LTWTGVAGTVLISSGAFILSFTALTDLASAAGIHPGLTWIWPLIVDGLIVVATIGVVALAGRAQVWYPWVLLIGASALSITANAVEATMRAITVASWVAVAVSAVPPLVLLAVTHLTVVLGKPVRQTTAVTTPQAPVVASTTHDAHMPVLSESVAAERPPTRPRQRQPRQASPGVVARDFVVNYLRAQGGSASASAVTQAGRQAGFAADTLRVARRRCTPPVVSTDTPDGWVWAIQDDAQPMPVCA